MTSKEALRKFKNIFGLGVIGRSLCEIIEQDLGQIKKYKKAIELLKKYIGFKLVIDSVDGVRGIEAKYDYSDISKQEYELLKEVLNYDREK